ncbi:squalene/phytoene synthase family protein [Henriciella marina]|uniref:Squalene/phytoene synthase family protein n=1 Tax=Henriciella marina TaxID=453851 RepID=A0ABT4LX38_9PROT|nr:squalene/phytoene synthase family protein [Henriciella marina]MCZ4298939.1 squalene/phytoene synthase family protein [Henriciella marina]
MTISSTPPGPEIWANIDRRLRTGDEDRWLSSRYAQADVRRDLIALYAFCWELARVRLIVTEPTLGAIRFQWWRDALAELEDGRPPRAHDVVSVVAVMLDRSSLNTADLVSIIVGYETAFEQKVRTLEPEAAIAGAAVRIVAPSVDLNPEIDGLVSEFAAGRRGEPPVERGHILRLPSDTLPALAHLRLRHLYARKASPGPLSKRLSVFKAVLSGKV